MAVNSRYQFQAFGLAIMVELILLAGAALALTNSSTKPVQSGSSTISLTNEEQQPVKPPAPKPRPKPQVVPDQPKPEIPQVTEAQANTFTEPTPPEVVAGKAEPSAEYVARIHAAVQAAHYYPPAASSLRYAGRVRVEFHLRDTVASELSLLVASGIGMIDRAALQAVKNAQYPEPPPEIRGTDHVYQVWVEFNRK